MSAAVVNDVFPPWLGTTQMPVIFALQHHLKTFTSPNMPIQLCFLR